METATLPAEDQGAPVEGDAEATRSTANLFQYSEYVHAGVGSAECENARDGKCKDPGHFHAWVCLPNSIQHRDILEKARAAKARRKRALRDAGGDGRPPSDAYVMLESDLDDALRGDTAQVVADMAQRSVRKRMRDVIREVREDDDRFADYFQDAEEWRRLVAMPEEERPTDEFRLLDEEMTAFEEAVKAEVDREVERERATIGRMPPENLREVLRTAHIEADTNDVYLNAYYIWLGYIGTRVVGTSPSVASMVTVKRYFNSLEDFRNGSPEAVEAVDNALRDLEGRMGRGEAAGN